MCVLRSPAALEFDLGRAAPAERVCVATERQRLLDLALARESLCRVCLG